MTTLPAGHQRGGAQYTASAKKICGTDGNTIVEQDVCVESGRLDVMITPNLKKMR